MLRSRDTTKWLPHVGVPRTLRDSARKQCAAVVCALIALQLLSAYTEYRSVPVTLKLASEDDADVESPRRVLAGGARLAMPTAAAAEEAGCVLPLPPGTRALVMWLMAYDYGMQEIVSHCAFPTHVSIARQHRFDEHISSANFSFIETAATAEPGSPLLLPPESVLSARGNSERFVLWCNQRQRSFSPGLIPQPVIKSQQSTATLMDSRSVPPLSVADDQPLRSGIVLDRDLNMNTLLAMYTAITNDSVTVDSPEGLYRAWLARAARACGVRLHIVLPLGYDEFRASSNITERAMDETHFFSTSELNVSDARLVAAETAHMQSRYAANALHVTRFALGQQSGGARVHVLRADELRQGCVSAAYARMLCDILDVGVGSGVGGGGGVGVPSRARNVSGDATSAARKGVDELCAACAEIAKRAQQAVIARRDELQRRLLSKPSYASVTSTPPTLRLSTQAAAPTTGWAEEIERDFGDRCLQAVSEGRRIRPLSVTANAASAQRAAADAQAPPRSAPFCGEPLPPPRVIVPAPDVNANVFHSPYVRPVIGDTRRLHRVLRQPNVTMSVFGDSVPMGHSCDACCLPYPEHHRYNVSLCGPAIPGFQCAECRWHGCSFVGGLSRWFQSNGARLGMPALRIQNDAVGATSMETVPKRAYQHTQASSPSEFDVYLLSFSLNDVAHYAFDPYFLDKIETALRVLLALPNEPAVIVHETAPSDTLLFGQSRPSYQYWRRRVLYRQIAAYYGVPVFSTSELMAQPFVRAKALHRQDDHPGEDLAAAIACVLASELYRERLLSLAVGTSDAARTHGESTVDRESLPPALFSRDCELYDMSSSNRTERGWENFCNLHQGIGWWFGEDPNSIGLAMHGFNAGSADWQVRNGLAEKLRTDRTSPLATAFASVRLMPLLLVTRMQVRDTQRDVEIGVTFTRGYDRTWGIATMFAARTLHELLLLRECGERCVRRELDGHHEQRVTIAVIERVTLPAATVRGSVDAPAMSSELFACVSESGMPTVRANRREQGAPFVYVAVLAPTDGRKFFVWDITTEHCRSE